MDKDESILDEELDIEGDEDISDIEPDTDAEGDDEADDEFEYDEDGNIIIPDVVYDDEEEEEGDAEDGGDEDGEASEDSAPTADEADGGESTADARDAEIAELRQKLRALETQGKDTLKKLGVESDDVMNGLASLAAEADGITTEEYISRKNQADKDEEARRLFAKSEFEKKARADLAELHTAYPETKSYKDIRELPTEVLKKFGKYRDMGLSAKAAYAAANPDGIRSNVAAAVKKQSLNETKKHLQTAVPKGSKDTSISMPKKELAYWRDLFPGKSDKEIVELYRKTAK